MAAVQNLPRVLIIGTGGTIAGKGASATSAGYTPGKLSTEYLLEYIPAIKQIANISAEQITSIGSYDLQITNLIEITRHINEAVDNNEADAVVITHGTDTMEETAYFLSLTLNVSIPVVLTGSMRAATALSSDGPKNLYDAIVVASNSQSKGKGVMVCFNETIYDARNVVKVNTTNVASFSSPNAGPIGHVYDGKVYYLNNNQEKAHPNAAFNISKINSLPHVEIAYMYLGASDSAINAFINDQVNGIVIAGTGDGSLSKPFLRAVGKAIEKGIIVVRSTRAHSGRVSQFHHVFDDKKLATISAGDLNPQKARILLMLALTATKDRNTIQEMFMKY
ncbi:MAG: asparaginase [Candidatus Dadabacteria bacterium]